MKVKMGLSQKSIQKAIKQIEKYKSDINRKCEEYVDRLAKIGEQVAIQAINESPIGNQITLSIDREPSKMGCKAVLIATGKVHVVKDRDPFYTVLAVEFGAGIHYNPEPNPKANDMGYGVGTYPGQIHAFEDGWYYLGEDNKWHYSKGIKSTMPIYKASMEIISQYEKIFKEVFS